MSFYTHQRLIPWRDSNTDVLVAEADAMPIVLSRQGKTSCPNLSIENLISGANPMIVSYNKII
jgi:hypothetical protein